MQRYCNLLAISIRRTSLKTSPRMALYNSSTLTNTMSTTAPNKRIFAPGGTNDSQQAQQYTKGSLDATQLDANPLTQFNTWFTHANAEKVHQPSTEITGTVSLPRKSIERHQLLHHLTCYTVARVKKIIHADDDIANCSNNAAFAITAATELFLQYLVEQTQNVVKAEKKPRRNIQYKDVGQHSPTYNTFHHSSLTPS